MTGALDSLARGLASSLLGQYGKAMTLTRTVAGAYDPATGTTGAPTVTAVAVNGYLDGFSLQGYGTAFKEGLIQDGDQKASIPALGLSFDPAPGDTLTIDGWPWTVIKAQPTWSGEQVAMWDLQVRK